MQKSNNDKSLNKIKGCVLVLKTIVVSDAYPLSGEVFYQTRFYVLYHKFSHDQSQVLSFKHLASSSCCFGAVENMDSTCDCSGDANFQVKPGTLPESRTLNANLAILIYNSIVTVVVTDRKSVV